MGSHDCYKSPICRIGSNSYFLVLIAVLTIISINIGVSASALDDKNSKAYTTEEDILGIGKTVFIVICVAAGVVIIGIPIACCFCCACLCFSGRSKSPDTNLTIVAQQSTHKQQQQPYYHQGQSTAMSSPNNNYSSNHQHQHPSPPMKSYPDPQFVNSPYPASTTPTSIYQDNYGPRFEQRNGQTADPNLIVNRFNRPPVPPKPNHRQESRAWNAVNAEVRIKNKIKQNQAQNPEFNYDNDGYDGGSLPSISSNGPNRANNANPSQTDNFMY